ncbi:MAG TPA: MFS transporter [Polyangiaceae bacterium]|nr:MFS transporter [Polyangiaceae bacterium]
MNARPSEPLFRPAFVRLLTVQPLAGFAICVFYLLPKYITLELHGTPSEVGLTNTVYGASSVVVVPFLAAALDRWSPRRIVLAGIVMLAVAAAGFLAVDRFGVLLLTLRAIQGVAWALLFTAGMMLTIRVAPKARMAQAFGYYGAANLAMNAVAPAVAEMVAEAASWKVVFAIAAGIAAVALVLARGLPEGEAPPRADPTSLVSVLLRPSSLWMTAIVVVWGAAFGAMFTFSQPFALLLKIRYVRGFFIAYTLAALFSRLGMGRLPDRVGYHRISVGSLGLYGAVVLSMQWLEPGWLEPIGAVFGLAHGLFFPAFSALTVEGTSEAERGKIMSLSNGGFNLGFALSGVVFGPIAERSGFPTVFLVAGLATFGGVAFLLSGRPADRAARSRVPLSSL